jgi:hypothetical protein
MLPTQLGRFLRSRLRATSFARDNSKKIKGAETTLTDKCNDCDELNLVTLQNDNADLKKKVDEAAVQVKDLTGKLADSEKKAKDATDALNLYKEAEKKALMDSITQRSQFKADELKDKSVEELRTIHVTIDKVKPPEGTVKNVRGADGASPAPNITADGRIDTTKSIMGNPVRQADGSIKWVVK